MSKVKQIGEIILEIAVSKEYENSAVAQWYNRKRNMMKDFEFVGRLVKGNQYLSTEEEKAWCCSALFGALEWGYRVDREQDAYNMAQKRKSIICRA